MIQYRQMSHRQLQQEATALAKQYTELQAKGLKLDLSRGKPEARQLDLSRPMLDILNSESDFLAEDGAETRNYGGPAGIPEARALMGELLGLAPDEVIIGGNSSLNLMHDCMGIGFIHGFPGGSGPWHRQGPVKFLCPSPGYDRHFAVTEHFGIELVRVPMTAEGPDMDVVEDLIEDELVKGIWCVPKYSNPTGITFSDDVVRRLAGMRPAAGDFRIFWDNAYAVHDIYPDRPDQLLNLMDELKKNGRQDMVLMFTSTSKITLPGAGISAVGASTDNIDYLLRHFSLQTIGYDKVNQLRHVRFLKDMDTIRAHMAKHAEFMRPKFEATLQTLDVELGGLGIAEWSRPNGGYFISLDVLDGCARRTLELCKGAGVAMTPAGAPFPYGDDPHDSNIRIAPSFAAPEELRLAAALLCLCARIACIEKLAIAQAS